MKGIIKAVEVERIEAFMTLYHPVLKEMVKIISVRNNEAGFRIVKMDFKAVCDISQFKKLVVEYGHKQLPVSKRHLQEVIDRNLINQEVEFEEKTDCCEESDNIEYCQVCNNGIDVARLVFQDEVKSSVGKLYSEAEVRVLLSSFCIEASLELSKLTGMNYTGDLYQILKKFTNEQIK